MANTLPNWLIGENLTTVQLIAQARAANGDLTDTTPNLTVTSVCRRVRLDNEPIHEDIRPVDSQLVHNVIVGEDNTLTLSLIKVKTGLNPLANLVTSTNYIKAIFTWGGEQWTGFFTRGRYSSGVENYGGNEEELTLRQVEVNDVNGSVQLVAV